MHRTIDTWRDFRLAWDGALNFLMAGACVPFHFDLPPLADVVDQLRRDPEARLSPGQTREGLDLADIADDFRRLPIETAMERPFALGHFKLDRFYGHGQLFHGFVEQVLDPWHNALRLAGFTWTRCYPIVFISGRGCLTGYHMDHSHVLAWQRYGVKRFVGLRDPDRFAPAAVRRAFAMSDHTAVRRPPALARRDELAYEMEPGDVLWNALHTPHWVEAADQPAMSINLSHGGLRLYGQLAPRERDLQAWRGERATGLGPRA